MQKYKPPPGGFIEAQFYKQLKSEKKNRYLSITDDGWDGASEVARATECSSVSELLKKIGRVTRF